jgi:SAM-dependent methyltransferase
VLEYGIGNGRIALPIARDGARVTGVDRSTPMLTDLRARLAEEPASVRSRVKVRRGDMRTVAIDTRFPLVICPFNTALHLYTRHDVEAWLARVRDHIAPRGELVLDVNMPIIEDLADPPGTEYALPPFVHPTRGRVRYREIFDYDRVRQIQFCSMCFSPMRKDGRGTKDDELVTPLAHRVFFPQELEALLHYNGFETTQIHGDFEGGPLRQDSDVMVFHARPRRSR